jgi:hypothetical protein
MALEYEQIVLTSRGETILESELMISAHLFSCEFLPYASCLALTSRERSWGN